MTRVLAVGLLGLALLGGRADAQIVVIGVGGELSGVMNTHVRAPVYADMRGAPGATLGSYTVRVQWDPNVLSLWAVEEGPFGTPLVNTDSGYAGVARVAAISVAGMDGLFDLFALQFDVLANATTAVTLTVMEAVAAGTLVDLTSFVTVVSGSYCPAVGRWGDLDADGVANSRDALAILSAVVGLAVDPSFTLALGDVDGDGQVNSRDALITLSHAVGLAIPGQRLLVLAPGPCGTSGATGLVLMPDTLDIVVGQYVRPLLGGASSAGPAGTSVTWSTADPEIAVVGIEGTVIGRSAGTTTVTAALGPGLTASVPVIVRARRGVWHVDAGRATLAAIQMGTSRYPFATPQYAFPVAAEGDTVRIAPGVHDYLGPEICSGGFYGDGPPGGAASPPPEQCAQDGLVTRGVTLVGDTLADGTRPVLRGYADAWSAVLLRQGAWIDVRDLEFRNFEWAAFQDGGARFMRLENVLIDASRYGGGVASYYSQGLDSLVLRGVEIYTDSLYGDYAADIEYAGAVLLDRLTVRSEYGLYMYAVDSVDMRDSDIEPYRSEALYVSGNYDQNGVGIYLARNRIRTSAVGSDYGIIVYGARTVRTERNVFRMVGQYVWEVFDIEGLDYPARPGSYLSMFGDSLIREPVGVSNYATGPYTYELDSVLVDSLTVVLPDSGHTFYPGYLYANTVRLSGSDFTNGGSGYPLYVYADDITVENSRFTGCRLACGGAYGLELDGYSGPLARAEITGNSFYRMTQAARVYYYGDAQKVYITANTADSITGTVFTVYGDSIWVADNVLTRTFSNGIYTAPGYLARSPWVTLERNRVTAGPGAAGYRVQLQASGFASTGNYLSGTGYGLYAYNTLAQPLSFSMTGDTIMADSALGGYALWVNGQWNGSISDGRILGGDYGAYLTPSAGGLTVDSTVFSGTRTFAVYAAPSAGVTITGRKNNVTDNRGTGVRNAGSGTVTFTLGRFVLNRGYAVYGTAGAVDASSSWWGDPAGPNISGVSDSTFGASVTTANFLTGDPADVPPLTPPGGVFAAAAWLSPFGRTMVAAVREPPAAPERPDPAGMRMERDARRRASLEEHRALRQTREVRRAEREGSRP